jgi:hypothetical protein
MHTFDITSFLLGACMGVASYALYRYVHDARH